MADPNFFQNEFIGMPTSQVVGGQSGPNFFSDEFTGANSQTATDTQKKYNFTDRVEDAATFGLGKQAGAAGDALVDYGAGALGYGPKMSFGDAYRANLADQRQAEENYDKEHPVLSPLASAIGMFGGAGPGESMANGVATLGSKILNGIKSGTGIGVAQGVGDSDLSNPQETAQKGAISGAIGAATGGLLPVALEAAKPVTEAAGRVLGLVTPEEQANTRLAQALTSSGGPQEAINRLNSLNVAPNQPLSLADVGGPNVTKLAGTVYRTGGDAGNTIFQTLNDRDASATDRLTGSIDSLLSSGGDAFTTAKTLQDAKVAASAPLYDTAFQGGSMAPLQDQFRTQTQAITGQKGAVQQALTKIENENPGALAARGAAGADTRAQYMDLHNQLGVLEQQRVDALNRFKQAQADGTANAPGAVWNPRIQQFLDDPIMRPGIARGLEIQRLENLAAGKPFNPTEYAITGTDDAGKPIVGAVPNMRTLDAAKKGLDAIIGDHQNEFGQLDQYGRAVNQVKQSFLQEIDQINPQYANARQAWAGPSASQNAIKMGQSFLRKSPAQIQEELGDLEPGQRDFYALGAADTLKNNISGVTGDSAAGVSTGGNEANKIAGNPALRAKISALGVAAPQVDDLISRARAETQMFNTKQSVMGGSQTAERLNADHGAPSGPLTKILTGGVQSYFDPIAGVPKLLGGAKDLLTGQIGTSPKVNSALAKALMDPNVAQRIQTIMAQRPPSNPAPLLNIPTAPAGGSLLSTLLNARGPAAGGGQQQ